MLNNDSGNWPYSELSKTAKEHGGPEALIADIKADSYEEGKTVGMLEGGVIVGAIGLVLAFGFNVVRKKWQSRTAMRAKSHVSEEELKAKLREYEAQQMSEGNENVNPSDSYAAPSEEERD